MKFTAVNALSVLFGFMILGVFERGWSQGKPQETVELVSGGYLATVETSLGNFEIELYTEDAPKTVTNFVKLAQKKYFDGQRVHRVVPNFVIQTGDDKSKNLKKKDEWGTGGTSIYGKEFEDELNPTTASYKEGYIKGVVAMANRGPNTNTSQFFVMLANNTTLPKAYTIFGKVVKGIEVVDKIAASPLVPGTSLPKVDVVLNKVSVKKLDAAPSTK